MSPDKQSNYDQMIQFLRDHEQLDELLKDDAPVPVWYDPVVLTKREMIAVSRGSRIDSFVKIEGGLGVHIGRYVHIASFAHLNIGGGQLFIGDFAAVASGARIISGSNQLYAASMSACAPESIQLVEKKRTRMGRFSCVLVNATVFPGVELGEGAVLAAGAVATKDIPAWQVWGGVPAKFLKHRAIMPDHAYFVKTGEFLNSPVHFWDSMHDVPEHLASQVR
jgi:acetyltransferase-like isoleucine patch superfamily enzyme